MICRAHARARRRSEPAAGRSATAATRRRVASTLLTLLTIMGSGCAGAPEQLLESATLTVGDGGTPSAIRLPRHFALAPAQPAYRLTFAVVVREALRHEQLMLVLPSLPAVVTVYFDGQRLPLLDRPFWERYRRMRPQSFLLPPPQTVGAGGRLELVVEHRWSPSTWIDLAPRLLLAEGRVGTLGFIGWLNFLSSACCCGFISFACLVYGAVFLIDRRRQAEAWLTAQFGFAGLYEAWMLGVTQPLFGVYDTAIVMVALTLAVVSSVYHLHFVYRLPRPRLTPLLTALAIAYVAVTRSPFRAPQWDTPLICVAVLSGCIYHIIVIARLPRSDRARHKGLLTAAGWIGLVILSSTDFVFWLRLGVGLPNLRLASVGLMWFGLLQIIALSRDYTLSLASIEELNVELQTRISDLEVERAQVGQLNEELRRQIADRSRELANALASIKTTEATRPQLLPDTIVCGRYRIVEQIGAGGMGTVYAAKRLSDDARVAIKCMHESAGPSVMARVAREAGFIAELRHPNVVSVLDIGTTEGGDLFIAMELVVGTSLEAMRSRFGQCQWALPLLRQLLAAVAAIHEQGVIHRDLKPSNLLDCGGQLKIIDFGVSALRRPERELGIMTPPPEPRPEPRSAVRAAQLDETSEERRRAKRPPVVDLTHTGVVVGTPRYMAPELHSGADMATPKSDLYACGLIARELLLPPDYFEQRQLKISSVAVAIPCPPAVAPAFWTMVERCLDEDPARRPDASELLGCLDAPLGASS